MYNLKSEEYERSRETSYHRDWRIELRNWIIIYYRGIPFLVSDIENENSAFSKEGDFLINTYCTAAELPYPFWRVGKRTVFVRDYNNFMDLAGLTGAEQRVHSTGEQ